MTFDGWHRKTIGHLFYASTSSFVHHFIIICEFRLSYGPQQLSWVVTSVTLTFDLWPWPFAWTSLLSLSHPSLGWLYVFSSFPPPRPLPPPPSQPQWLLLLTSKPLQLHLRYLGQRKYWPGKMYWMMFWWPWPKVTAVTLINKNLLFCRIKWELLNQSLQNLAAISLWSC